MARHRDDVLGREHRRLLEDAAPHLGERQAIALGIVALEPPGRLHRLQRDAADARLLEREVDDLADLAGR